MARLTIPRTVMGKIGTQLSKNKPEDGTTKQMLAEVKKTATPTQDTILWDPPADLIQGLAVTIAREIGFMRKPDSASYKLMQKTLADLQKFAG